MSIASNSNMFSPATFYDVLTTDPGKHSTDRSSASHPPIVAFYGFRGGAGRTLALAHAASILARRGAKLALVDLDLEAPGLHSVLSVPAPPEGSGAAYALREGLRADSKASAFHRHLFQVPDAGGELILLPSGPIDTRYLATIEELNVQLWHALPTSPLLNLLTSLSKERPELDAVFLDCRTGFHGMTATALFHLATIVVLVTPLSDQIWDGVGAVFEGIRISRSARGGLPGLLVVPAMIPPGEPGNRRLAAYQERLIVLHDDTIRSPDDQATAEDPDQPSWLLNGIRYDLDVALGGVLNSRLKGSAADGYRELADAIATNLGFFENRPPSGAGPYPSFDTSKVLRELRIPPSTAYAEEIPSDELDDLFINSSDYERIVDRLTVLVIGAKGAGKTLLWRKLLQDSTEQNTYAPGHGPAQLSNTDSGPLNLSADTLKELERIAKLERNANYRAFWRFYAVAQILRSVPTARNVSFDKRELSTAERKIWTRIQRVETAADLTALLKVALVAPTASTFSERLLDKLDAVLTSESSKSVTLLYDGLDTGFDVGKASVERRKRFVTALLQTIAEGRGRYRRILFKVFLREDVWFEAELQNKSHLEAARTDLVWRPEDLWRIALRLALTSDTYRQIAENIAPGVSAKAFTKSVEEETLRQVLVPLWGDTIESGKNAITSNYIQKRMSDAQGRLFPRTFVQLLETAVEQEKRQRELLPNRLLRFTSIRQGMREASKQRVNDLRTEYSGLSAYLDLLRGTEATGTLEEWIERFKKKWSALRRASKVKDVALHIGPGGWSRVIDYLQIVGVLGLYRRSDRPKLQVALLYRFGLEVKGSGLQ